MTDEAKNYHVEGCDDHIYCDCAERALAQAQADIALLKGQMDADDVRVYDLYVETRDKLNATSQDILRAQVEREKVRQEILKRWRFKNVIGEYRCDDCCHLWPDGNGVPLTCAEEPMDLCREGHECHIRPVLEALTEPGGQP